MWYKIESKAIIIYMSDELIAINPDLATDLSAEILTSLIRVSYWDLLSVFQNNDINKVKKVLKAFKLENRPPFIEKSGNNVVGCLLQKSGRKNITNTYFTYENNTLLVSKRTESDIQRCSIVNEKVLSGKYLLPELSARINKNDIAGFESLFIESIESVFKSFKVTHDSNLLKSEAIDCIAKNIIITDGGFDFFDIEYAPNIILTKSHFIFRCALGFSKQYIKRNYWPYKSPYDLYCVFCNHLSIKPDVENDIKSELNFRKPILVIGAKGLSYKELKRGFYNKTPLIIKTFRYLKNKLN
tara:strand:- start:324 stop:1220 length:897 start_codon:yes stop_codon:yes gene_type:complete